LWALIFVFIIISSLTLNAGVKQVLGEKLIDAVPSTSQKNISDAVDKNAPSNVKGVLVDNHDHHAGHKHARHHA
jgi:hypothetical protein